MAISIGKPVRRDDGRTNQWGLVTGSLLGAVLGEIVFAYAVYQLQWTRLSESLLLNVLSVFLYSVMGIIIGLLVARHMNRLKGHIMVQQDSEPYLLGALWIFVVLNLYGHLASPFRLIDVPYSRFPFADSFWLMLGWTGVKAILVVIVSAAAAFILYEIAILIKPRPARKWTLKRKKKRKIPWIPILFALSWPAVFFGLLFWNQYRRPVDTSQPAIETERQAVPTLVLAWNQADWETIQPLLEEGRMPNLKALIEQGVFSEIRPTSNPVPETVWTSLLTGRTPAEHGVIGSTVYDIGPFREKVVSLPDRTGLEVALRILGLTPLVETRPVAPQDRWTPALWEQLIRVDTPAAVIGGSLAAPQRSAGNTVINRQAVDILSQLPGAATPEPILLEAARWVSPTDWVDQLVDLEKQKQEELDDLFRRVARLSPEETAELAGRKTPLSSDHPWAVLKSALREDLLLVEAAKELQQNDPPRMTLLYLDGLRQVQDRMWEYRRPDQAIPTLRERPEKYGRLVDYYYEWLDEKLGELMQDGPGGRAVAVVSGFGRGGIFIPSGADPSADVWGQSGFMALAGEAVPQSKDPLPSSSTTDLVPILSRIMGLEISGIALSEPWQNFFLSTPQANPAEVQKQDSSSEQIESITNTISQVQTHGPAPEVSSTTRTVP